MMYLVDTNVLSEPTRKIPNQNVIEWLTAHERELLVDPIILGELQFGIFSLPKSAKRTRLQNWFDSVAATIECVAWDRMVSRHWAELMANLRRSGHPMPLTDSMIAATARAYKLTIATRDVRDFRRVGVKAIDPFS
ncbi:MAG: PIN domain-containing protein [Candidatus Hydrogenedentes bacterium]|nr:PIN domain-containing protein [Candidatus Hydrogenedentota bacterium]